MSVKYAIVSTAVFNVAAGKKRKVRCGCNGIPRNKFEPIGVYKKSDYFNCFETGADKCTVCGEYFYYTI